MKGKTIAKILSDIVVPILVLSIAFYSLYAEQYNNLKELGEWAFRLLILLLIIKPLAVVFPKIKVFRKSLMYRRELGHVLFFFAAAHGLFYFYTADFIIILAYVFGLISLFILFTMLLTSNIASKIKLGKWWKKLHSLIYVVLILTLLHIYFIAGEIDPDYIVLTTILIIFKVIEYYKLKKK